MPPQSLLFTDDQADNIAAAARRGWRAHRFESFGEAAAARLVAEEMLTQKEGPGCDLEIVPKEAERLLTWPGLLAAFEAGHRLPQPDMDLFCYRRRTPLDRATSIERAGRLGQGGHRGSGQCRAGQAHRQRCRDAL